VRAILDVARIPGCSCLSTCELPCWQRVGIAEACAGCGCSPFDENGEPFPVDKRGSNPDRTTSPADVARIVTEVRSKAGEAS
jgi:hypothetical protein